MNDRWRKPVEIVAIESDPSGVVRYGQDERLMRNYDVTVTKDSYERMYFGYMCAQCYEPFATAWPDTCYVCGFAVKEGQMAWLNRVDGGAKWIGPTESYDDELERLEEENQRRIRAKRDKPSIWVPGNARLN